MAQFTIDELIRLLHTCSGGDAPISIGDDIADMDFDDLGFDSLTLFNTIHRIEHDYGIELPDQAMIEFSTPRELLNEVATRLRQIA